MCRISGSNCERSHDVSEVDNTKGEQVEHESRHASGLSRTAIRSGAVAIAAVAGLALVVPSWAAPIPTGEETTTGTEGACSGGMNNSLEAVHPTLLWPPNHKYYGDGPNEDLYFLASDGDGGEIVLTTSGTHDQYDEDGSEFNGSGNTGDEDGDGVADDVRADDEDAVLDTSESSSTQPVYVEEGSSAVQTDWVARAERAGTGVRLGVPNRTYTLTGVAEFSDGGTCTVEFDVVVPHDMGKGDGNGKKDPVR